MRNKKSEPSNKLVHSNSCESNQDIASSGTNSQIGILSRMFRWEAKYQFLGQSQKARDSSIRIELIFR
ncbi:hypothetical protein [Prochlorococcus sp. MIT 1011]|uniref:hypothetical protein n=1 Tax=Prochlorococcus sp. MIT 1011 TaxID=3082520 RepID=UPI0039B4904A